MAHRHVIPIHRAGVAMTRLLGREVGDDLVAVEVEVHPRIRAAALGAAEQLAVEAPGRGQVIDREGEVEKGDLLLLHFFSFA
jgi:hypothetical protein